MLIWFTGLSGSGKTTLARALQERLYHIGKKSLVLDGDEVRRGLCSDLGYSMGDRAENIRRISEVAKLFVDAGFITLAAFISPAVADRRRVRRMFGDSFVEVFVRCPIEVCEARDIKGLYKKARTGKLLAFTGISSVYEEPEYPDYVIDTEMKSVRECINELIVYLADWGVMEAAQEARNSAAKRN